MSEAALPIKSRPLVDRHIQTCLGITLTSQTAALLVILTMSAENEKLLQALLSVHSVIKGKASIPNWRVLLEGTARRTSSRSQ